MLSEQTAKNTSKQVSRCDELALGREPGSTFTPLEKQDAGLKTEIAKALWKDDVLRALDYYEIDVRVKSGIATLNGHIASSRSQNRVEHALRKIPGIVDVRNQLISDDNLALDVAAALGGLEHTYGCKFFTGASHGVISLNGTVRSKNIKLQAEKCVSDNPNTRGVINNIQVTGSKEEVQNLPFLQPAIGEDIYFLDWVSGVVKQVIMNPNNRRVIAMIVLGKFTNQQAQLYSSMSDRALLSERLIVIPMATVRNLTRTSGFLYINSDQRNQYMDFAPVHFTAPPQSWLPPYPYCPDDVLFPVEYKDDNMHLEYKPDPYSFAAGSKDTPLGVQLLANDSPGG